MIDKLSDRIRHLLGALSSGLIEREDHVKLMLLAALAGEHVLLIGPPGTAKSLLARRLRLAFRDATFFERLLTQFSVPEDLFGPYSLEDLDQGRYRRLTEGYLADADVCFLDEIFKSNPSVLNALLTLLNERVFHNVPPADENGNSATNAPLPLPVPLKCLVGASNEVPEPGELDALYDRFLVRCEVGPVVDFRKLLQSGNEDEPTVDAQLALTAEELEKIRKAAKSVIVPPHVDELLGLLRYRMAELRLDVSDRRWLKIRKLLQVAAYTSGRERVSPLDVLLVPHCVWSPRQEKRPANAPTPPQQGKKKDDEQPQAQTPVQLRNGLTTWLQERVWEPMPTQPGLLDRQIAAWETELQKLAKTPPANRDSRAIKNQLDSVTKLTQTTAAVHRFLHEEADRFQTGKFLEAVTSPGTKSPASDDYCEGAQRWLPVKATGHSLEQLDKAVRLADNWKARNAAVRKAFEELKDNTSATISAPKPVASAGVAIPGYAGGSRPDPYDFGHAPKDAMTVAPKFQQDWVDFLSGHPAVRSKTREVTQTFQKNRHAPSWSMDFMLIPPGELITDAKASHKISNPFLLGTFQVTREQWAAAAIGPDPWNTSWSGSGLPVDTVSWLMCVEFCNRLSEIQGLTPVYSGTAPEYKIDPKANGYRLPTEWEWEYACRAGTATKWWCGDLEEELKKIAWYNANSGSKTHPVSEKKQGNPFGLVGMHGNVWEWCQDNYDGDKSRRVLRGGSWVNDAEVLASACRHGSTADLRNYKYGCRVARTVFLDT